MVSIKTFSKLVQIRVETLKTLHMINVSVFCSGPCLGRKITFLLSFFVNNRDEAVPYDVSKDSRLAFLKRFSRPEPPIIAILAVSKLFSLFFSLLKEPSLRPVNHEYYYYGGYTHQDTDAYGKDESFVTHFRSYQQVSC